jgi:hypothetical protein
VIIAADCKLGNKFRLAKSLTIARQMLSGTGADLVRLGQRLRVAQADGKFVQFCAALPIHTRKAYDLIQIAAAVDRGLVTAGDVEHIGWTKACRIAPLEGKRRVQQAVAFARTNTVPALERYLKDSAAKQALVTKSFHLTADEAAEVEAALRQAGAKVRGNRIADRSEPLMRIIRAFKATPTRGTRGSAK